MRRIIKIFLDSTKALLYNRRESIPIRKRGKRGKGVGFFIVDLFVRIPDADGAFIFYRTALLAQCGAFYCESCLLRVGRTAVYSRHAFFNLRRVRIRISHFLLPGAQSQTRQNISCGFCLSEPCASALFQVHQLFPGKSCPDSSVFRCQTY